MNFGAKTTVSEFGGDYRQMKERLSININRFLTRAKVLTGAAPRRGRSASPSNGCAET